MKQLLDSVSVASLGRLSRNAVVGGAAAVLLIGCAAAPDDVAKDSELSRTAQLKPRSETVGHIHEANQASLRDCFEAGQGEGASEELTRVEVEVQLPSSGTPSKVRVVNRDVVSPEVGTCLEEMIGGLQYGKSDHGATYYQTFIFDAKSDAVAFEEPISAYQRWGLTREEVRDVFIAHEDEIDQCYELATEKPTGRVVLNISIRVAGPPERVGIKSSTLESPQAESCLVESVMTMEFPAPRGKGITIREVPLHFNPQEGWRKPKPKRVKHSH
ncbi:AgmX/PglI C-terminal domain-containing protein [Bradymonas sediminis]|uniref:AgmX/PglI C-terminal domain-containing protein n=1 Tax=Bradymonas sediminis TaxID=1548548 RepID=UPI0010E0E6C7|nr:AgmX/PglI C-terminal domain-containing protein [Bradymonas sediminis]TDP73536.1 hypothetical protein DFR33_106179 [Bradymonas sediminis]